MRQGDIGGSNAAFLAMDIFLLVFEGAHVQRQASESTFSFVYSFQRVLPRHSDRSRVMWGRTEVDSARSRINTGSNLISYPCSASAAAAMFTVGISSSNFIYHDLGSLGPVVSCSVVLQLRTIEQDASTHLALVATAIVQSVSGASFTLPLSRKSTPGGSQYFFPYHRGHRGVGRASEFSFEVNPSFPFRAEFIHRLSESRDSGLPISLSETRLTSSC